MVGLFFYYFLQLKTSRPGEIELFLVLDYIHLLGMPQTDIILPGNWAKLAFVSAAQVATRKRTP